MRDGLTGLISTIVFGAAMLTVACADYSGSSNTTATAGTTSTGSGTGGSSSTGGGGGQKSTGGTSAGGGTSCTGLTQPCGGDLVGTWNVTSSCLTVSGQADLTAANIGCLQAPATGSRRVTGTWTFNGTDLSFTDATTTTGDDQVFLAPVCLATSGTIIDCNRAGNALITGGYESADCAADTAGTGCNCTAHINQTGGMALVSANPITDGIYDNTTVANTVTPTNGRKPVSYSYCVAGSTLTVATQSTAPVIAGTVIFTKQ